MEHNSLRRRKYKVTWLDWYEIKQFATWRIYKVTWLDWYGIKQFATWQILGDVVGLV